MGAVRPVGVRGRVEETTPQRPGSIALAGLAAAALAAGLGLWGGRTADTGAVDGYGLLPALPVTYRLGLLLAVLATGLLMRAAVTENGRYAQAVPPLWLALLHIGPHLAHDHPRGPLPSEHIGLARLVGETGTADAALDGRLAWPGGLAVLMAIVADLGPTALDGLLRIWPGLLLGGTGVLVAALARRCYPTVPLIGPIASVVYLLGSWTGQDQLSAHGLGFAAGLALLVILETGPLRAAAAWSPSVSMLDRFAAAAGDRPFARTRVAFAALLVLGLAATVSHPIAPFFVCFALLILGLHGRRAAHRLLAVLAAVFVLWLVVAAQPWWSASPDGPFAGWSALLDDRPSVAPEGSLVRPPQRFAEAVRSLVGLSVFGAIAALGAVSATDRFRHLRPAIPLAPLALIPAAVLALRPVGNDRAAVVGLFALPAAAVLVARWLTTVRVKMLALVLPGLALSMTPLLLLARYGGEAFEMTTAADRAAVVAAAESLDEATLVVADNRFVAIGDLFSAPTLIPASTSTSNLNGAGLVSSSVTPSEAWVGEIRAEAEARGLKRVLVVLTPSQARWRHHRLSAPIDELDRTARWLAERPGAEVLHQQDGGWVIAL